MKVPGLEYPIGRWNEMSVTVEDKTVEVKINGVVVNEGIKCTGKGGAVCFFSDGAPIEFRYIVLWPGTNWR